MTATREIVYDEFNDVETEVLTADGVEKLLDCFFTDIRSYLTHYNSGCRSPVSWDISEESNWDYAIMGVQDLYTYCEHMADICEQQNDMQSSYAYVCAMPLLEDLEQVFGEVFDFLNGDTEKLDHDLYDVSFWYDLFHLFVSVRQCIDMEPIGSGGYHD